MITGIIMAAGFSKRMKRDKLMLDFGGLPIIERVIKAVKDSEVDTIIIVYRDERIKEIGMKYDIKMVSNEHAYLGQSQSIKLGIQLSPVETEGYMFFVGDQPFLTTDTINSLIEVFKEGKYPIVVPEYDEKRGNPVIFSAQLRDELLRIEGDEGGRSIIKKRCGEVKRVHMDRDIVGKDIDTWDEYLRWR